jgi:hypothetical protein
MTLPRSAGGCSRRARDLGGRVHRPDVSQRVPASAAARGGVVSFLRPSRASLRVVRAVGADQPGVRRRHLYRFAKTRGSTGGRFVKGQRKDDWRMSSWPASTSPRGCCSSAGPRRRAPVFRTEKRRNPVTGASYPWIVKTTAMVNHFYVYAVDADFGPFFIKFCSYFPYNAKSVHQRQRVGQTPGGQGRDRLRGLSTTASPSCEDPPACSASVTVSTQEDRPPARKWLARLPHPFTAGTVGPATATTSPSSKPSSPSPRCSTGPRRAGCSSRRSSARTSTSAAPTRSR